MSQQALSHEATEAAVDLLVKLSSGAVSDEVSTQFQLWLDADTHHQAAWQQLAQSMSGFEQVRHLANRQAGHANAVRQALVGKYVSTERRHFLKGGAAVVALDIDFSEKQRVLTLHHGACIVDVAPDALLPLLLRTVHGVVHATVGCRMLAGISGGRSYAMVQQQSLVVAPLHHNEAVLTSGEAVAAWFDQHILTLKPANVKASMAWEHGMLDVRDQSLEDAVESLRAYHAGWIRLSPRAAGLRVLGMFQLDDIGQVNRASYVFTAVHSADQRPALRQLADHDRPGLAPLTKSFRRCCSICST